VIVKFVVPATLSVALRAAPAFGATVKETVPLPLPVAPDEIAMKVALLVAVHAHPVAAVTGTDPVPPVAPNADAVMAPAATTQEGAVVVAVAVDVLFLQPEHVMTSNRRVAARGRRSEYVMNASSIRTRVKRIVVQETGAVLAVAKVFLMSSFALSAVVGYLTARCRGGTCSAVFRRR
jgi:hypothetical protein